MSVPFTADDMAALIARTVNTALDERLGTKPVPAKPAKVEKATTKVRVSPPVLALAEQHGIDLAAVTGTGKNGAICKADVMALVGDAAPVASAPLPAAETPKVAKVTTAKAVAEARDFVGHEGNTLSVSKVVGKKGRKYLLISSPNDPNMRVYASQQTVRVLAMVLRSNVATDLIKFAGDCR